MKAAYTAAFAALALILIALCPAQTAPAAADPVVVADFTNPGLSPSHWTLTLHPDGSGHFRSETGPPVASDPPGEIRTPSVDRDVQLSPVFAARIFQAAERHHWFNESCESHMKVAFQGTKTLSYSGPRGQGSCAFNYAKDKEIESLGDSLVAVADTILEGARLELLLQHDPLGLDKEMEALSNAAADGRAQQLCAIRDILERLAGDDKVLDLVRKRARALLAQAES